MIQKIETRVERGYACQAISLQSETSVYLFLVAYYSPAVLANGWEPYDQPDPAAWIPYPFLQFHREPLTEGGEILVLKRKPTFSPSGLFFTAIEDAFQRAGLSQAVTQQAIRTFGALIRDGKKV